MQIIANPPQKHQYRVRLEDVHAATLIGLPGLPTTSVSSTELVSARYNQNYIITFFTRLL